MTEYNQKNTLSRQIKNLERRINSVQNSPRLISASIDRGGVRSTDWDGTDISNRGTTGWFFGTDEATGVGWARFPVDSLGPGRLDNSKVPFLEYIGTPSNLDTYTTPGNYVQSISAQAASGDNYPAPYSGMLEVNSTPSSNLIWQRYTVFGGSPPNGILRTFTRNFWSGSWGAWNETVTYDSGWSTLSISNATGSQTAIRRIGNIVYLRGEIYNISSAGAQIATISSYYLPATRLSIMAPRIATTISAAAGIYVAATGEVYATPALIGSAVTASPGYSITTSWVAAS